MEETKQTQTEPEQLRGQPASDAGAVEGALTPGETPSTSPATLQIPQQAIVQQLKAKVTIFEIDDQIVIDIADNSGGLNLRLAFAPEVASKFGQDTADKARFLVSKVSGTKERLAAVSVEASLSVKGNN